MKVRFPLSTAAALAAAALLLLASCGTSSPYYDASRGDQPAHHTPRGFRNNYVDLQQRDFWKWRWQRWRDGLPKPPRQPTPSVAPEVQFLAANTSEPTLTWIGHSSLLLQAAGRNILIDPVLSERASPVSFAGPKRHAPPGLGFEQLPHIDAVLISHNHYDHLDTATVKRLAAQAGGPPLFIVPLGLEAWFRAKGINNVVELDWWDRVSLGRLAIYFVPSQHWSSRSLADRNETLWGGFYLKASPNKDATPPCKSPTSEGNSPCGLSFLYTGDTGYSKDFADIRARLGPPDLLAVPIGAYEPRWFMAEAHVNPEEALRIYQDLGAKYAVGVHWGTFELTDESLDEPPRALAAARVRAGIAEERFFVMKIGETRRIAPMLAAFK